MLAAYAFWPRPVILCIIYKPNFFLQRTICLNIWCVGALWTSPLSKFTGGSRWNSLPLATCGCTFSSSRNARVQIKLVHNLASGEKERALGMGQANPKQNKCKLIMFDPGPTPYCRCQVFVVRFCHESPAIFVILMGARRLLQGPSFLPKAMTGCGCLEPNCFSHFGVWRDC